MALIERLCQVSSEPPARHIALNPFCEALFSILGGYHTIAEIKAFYSMTAEDETEFDALVGRVTVYPDTHERDRAVHRIRSILTFWEAEIPAYDTVTEIRDLLNVV